MKPTVAVIVWIVTDAQRPFRLWGYTLGNLYTHELLEIGMRITTYTYVTVVQKKPVFQTSIKLIYIAKLNNVPLELEFNLNGIWVRDLPSPMHLGLRKGHLCPIFCTKLEEPCSFSKVPDGPYT